MFNLKKIKAIPCGDIARKHGLNIKEKHGRLWGKLRPEEKTESFSINMEKNLWYDFGTGEGGSVIDLLMEIEGISFKEAINQLANDYGLTKESTQGWRPLTDNQYRKIGIQSERATMNFAFDLNKHTVQQLERWSNKYNMSVGKLAEKHPKTYEKMLNKVAVREIKTFIDIYDSKIKAYKDPNTNKATKSFIKSTLKEDENEINYRVNLLKNAAKDSTFNYTYLLVNHENDLKKSNHQTKENPLSLSPDEKTKKKIVKVYKKLFNFKQVDYFTVKQAKALSDINIALSKSDNKFISINELRKVYSTVGKKLDKLESDYNELIKQKESILKKQDNISYGKWKNNINLKEGEIKKIKKIFIQCNIVIEAIRGANIAYDKYLLKQNEQKMVKNIELTQ